MKTLSKLLDEYCKEHDYNNQGINMYIFSHNDMLNFAQLYLEAKINKYVETKKEQTLKEILKD